MSVPVRARVPAGLGRLARAMDSAVRIPGTNVRVGLDALIGLVPGVGDLAGAAVAGYIVLASVRAGAPSAVLLRMLLNVAIDTIGGAVPVIGDLFDVGWRANTRNVALLAAHLDEPAATRRSSGVLVALVVVALVALLAVGGVLGWLALRALVHAVR